MASKALAKPTPEELEVAYAAILDGKELPGGGDSEAVTRSILERILAAETFEEIATAQTLEPWREYLDVPVLVKEFHLNPSGFEQGSSVYAVADIALLDSGEVRTVTCGGRNVLMMLVKMLQMGWMDKPVKLTAKKTAEGYSVLYLIAA